MGNIHAFFSILLLPIYLSHHPKLQRYVVETKFYKKEKLCCLDPVLMLNIILDSHIITSITTCTCVPWFCAVVLLHGR